MSVFRRAAARRGTVAAWLVVGLGNPGERYADTRHNVGAQAVQRWAQSLGCELVTQRREHARVAVATLGRHRPAVGPKGANEPRGEPAPKSLRVALGCPTTFMNDSGRSVGALIKRHGIAAPSQLVVVHDELDLEPGQVRVKIGGGTAGHNGLASIAAQLGTRDFMRVRIGIGKPPSPQAGRSWVLKRPPRHAEELIHEAVCRTLAGLEILVADGPQAAMNFTNARRRHSGSSPQPQ